jgi:chaperonin GroEL
MSKIIVFDHEAKEKLQEGINKLVQAVTSTLGPHGRNVIIGKGNENPHSTKDGVTVAKSIYLKDPIENIGAQMVKQASIRTAEQAGDGTTTSTLIAGTLINEGLKVIRTGINAVEVKRGMEKACKLVVNELKTISKDITTEEQIKQVAIISANNDTEIGNLVSAAMNKVGRDGIVTVEESRTGETSLEVVEGLQFERGYKSPYFVTDNNTMSAVLKDSYVLVYDKKITAAKDLLQILHAISIANKPLLIIAEDIDGEALATLVMNKARGTIQVCAVKAPDFGERRLAILEDIAILTGATVVSKDRGMSLEKAGLEWLGKARTVTINKDTTTIVDGKGDTNLIEERINSLKIQFDSSKSMFEKEKLQERIGRMVGGVAIINVGGANEIDMKEKKDRVDDALQATKAALEEGIVPGSGTTLLSIKGLPYKEFASTDEWLGAELVLKSLELPFAKICSNAGLDHYDYKHKLKPNQAFDIKAKKFVNAFESGIIDPTKVTRCALENAVSIAGSILITESVIYDDPTEEKQKSEYEL